MQVSIALCSALFPTEYDQCRSFGWDTLCYRNEGRLACASRPCAVVSEMNRLRKRQRVFNFRRCDYFRVRMLSKRYSLIIIDKRKAQRHQNIFFRKNQFLDLRSLSVRLRLSFCFQRD